MERVVTGYRVDCSAVGCTFSQVIDRRKSEPPLQAYARAIRVEQKHFREHIMNDGYSQFAEIVKITELMRVIAENYEQI